MFSAAVVAASFALTACGGGGEPIPEYSTVSQWCSDYKALISSNAKNLTVWSDTSNGLPLDSADGMQAANDFRDREIKMVMAAGKLGMFSPDMIDDRIAIDQNVFEPTLSTLTDAADQANGIGQLVAERKFVEFVDQVNQESQRLGYQDADDFLAQFGYQVSTRCEYDVQEIVDEFPLS